MAHQSAASDYYDGQRNRNLSASHRRAMMAHLLPDPHFDLNRYSPVKAVRNRWNNTDIGAEGLALNRQQRQRRDEPCAIAVVRIAIEGANRDPGVYVETCKLPVKGTPLVSRKVGPCAIAVDKAARHQFMVNGQQNLGTEADIVVAQTFAG